MELSVSSLLRPIRRGRSNSHSSSSSSDRFSQMGLKIAFRGRLDESKKISASSWAGFIRRDRADRTASCPGGEISPASRYKKHALSSSGDFANPQPTRDDEAHDPGK